MIAITLVWKPPFFASYFLSSLFFSSPFSHPIFHLRFPAVFPVFPIVFPLFPTVFPPFSRCFPAVFPLFPHRFPIVFPSFSRRFSATFLHFSRRFSYLKASRVPWTRGFLPNRRRLPSIWKMAVGAGLYYSVQYKMSSPLQLAASITVHITHPRTSPPAKLGTTSIRDGPL